MIEYISLTVLSSSLLLFLQQGYGDLHDGFLRFFVYFLHLLAQVILQIDCVLLRVDVYFTRLVEGIQSKLLHFCTCFFFELSTVRRYGDDLRLSLEKLRRREIVLEPKLLKLSWLASLV